MTELDRRLSDHLVRLVQILFALVLGQSLLLYRSVIVDPFSKGHWVAAAALGTVYVTTVLSWVDWHTTMELRPYNFNPHSKNRFVEEIRLAVDLIVVTLYAYILFAIEGFANNPDASIEAYLLGFPAVFLAYLLSGLARRRAHGRLASDPIPIVVFTFLYLSLYGLYRYSRLIYARILVEFRWPNIVAITFAFCLMLAYRRVRAWRRRTRTARKAGGLRVAVDLDGVLANQIDGILPRIRARLGVVLSYDQVTDWRLPIKDSDIASEIEIALEDTDYVTGMPLHTGGKDLLDAIYDQNRVIILTGRPPGTRGATIQWLEDNGLAFDEVVNVKELKKGLYGTDVLIDDYVGNVSQYLSTTDGVAILVDQPWNRDRSALALWQDTPRLHIVRELAEAAPILEQVRAFRMTTTGKDCPPRHSR